MAHYGTLCRVHNNNIYPGESHYLAALRCGGGGWAAGWAALCKKPYSRAHAPHTNPPTPPPTDTPTHPPTHRLAR
jgi:hypothetical protein